MPLIDTSLITPETMPAAKRQVYNGLDCMLTLEIFEEIQRLTNAEPLAYNFSRALQAPILEMMLRGFAVDKTERANALHKLSGRMAILQRQLDQLAIAVWDKPLNPRSTVQLQEFFYKRMAIPEIFVFFKGQRKLSMNREVLEKLDLHLYARPIVSTILAIRGIAKQIEVLETEVSSDGRMRTSYNIGGTETGRLSSSAASDGTGSNLQNIEPALRRMFIADPDMALVVIDLEQAESREVGWLCGTLFGDWRYLDACEGGDLHTTTCQLIWPNLPWTKDPKANKALAEQNFYRHYSYRDMSKRGGHGSNYYGKPFTMARHLKVPASLMVEFQDRYFSAFPSIPLWHRWVAEQLQTTAILTTPWGRERQFFGRATDDTTLREAIAYSPQSSTADRTNLGLLRIWQNLRSAQLLAQTHDSVSFQCPIALVDDLVPAALSLMQIPISSAAAGRTMIVPGEAKVGFNWAYYNEKTNPNGLRKWKPGLPLSRLDTLSHPLG